MAQQIPIVDYLVLDDGEPYLVANQCDRCGALYLGRRNGCARCSNRSFHRRRLTATGTVRSLAIVHQAPAGVPVPFVSVVVDLDGGGDVKANLVGVEPEPESIALGTKVRLTTFVAGQDDQGTEAVAFGFEPR